MKDELVTFETAKLAKEKGFNIPIPQNGQVYGITEGKIDTAIESNQIKNWNDDKYNDICSAPTQSLLQRWLRDEKNLWVWVDHYKNRTYTAHISDECDNSKSNELFGNIYYSYEQALENGLQEALKLI
jgi:hypothetical protein